MGIINNTKRWFDTRIENGKSIFDTFLRRSQAIWIIISGFFASLLHDLTTLHIGLRVAGRKNFKLGIRMLKNGNLIDARFRFWLADKFYPNSPVNQYYMAYTYYLHGMIGKALMYLEKCTRSRRTGLVPRIATLIDRIDDLHGKKRPLLMKSDSLD